MSNAAIYTRLSASGLGEDAPGLRRQEEACERFVRERGWELVGSYRDPDISAFSGARRPGLEELVAGMEAGDVDVMVAWKLDRAFRSSLDANRFLSPAGRQRRHFISVTEGIDTTTTWGPVLFNIFAAMAELESRTRSERALASHLQRAQQGAASGGGTRPYGFREDRVRHEPAEVRVVRWAAERILSGDSLRSVVRRLNERGTPTVTGRPWAKTVVRRLLTSPRTAGLREHGGITYKGTWRPILDEETWLALCGSLLGRPGPEAGRRYLLTGGLAVCGLCGANLVARPRGDGRRCYVCATDYGGCGKIRILAAEFEEHVAERANTEHEDRHLVRAEPERRPAGEALRRQLDGDTAALEDLSRQRFVHRTITEAEFRAAREPLAHRITETQAELSKASAGRRTFLTHLDDLPAPPWEAEPGTDPEDLESWRGWVGDVVQRVEVGPAVRGRNFFDPERVTVQFRPPTPGGSA